jgi:hypothetical protein
MSNFLGNFAMYFNNNLEEDPMVQSDLEEKKKKRFALEMAVLEHFLVKHNQEA